MGICLQVMHGFVMATPLFRERRRELNEIFSWSSEKNICIWEI